MAKLFSNFERGTLGAGLTTGSTTIDFTGSVPGFATLSGGDTRTLVIDPFEEQGLGPPEIVYLTAYTAAATTGTITRAQEGTSDPGVTWPAGTRWIHTHTAADVGGAGGGVTVIDTLSSPTTGEYTFTGLTLSSYSKVEIVLENMEVDTDDVDISLRFSISSSFVTTGYKFSLITRSAGAALETQASTSADGIRLTDTTAGWGLGNAVNESLSGTVGLFAPGGSGFKHCNVQTTYTPPSGELVTSRGGGVLQNTGAIDGIKLLVSVSGQLDAGVVRLLGYPAT